MLSSSELTAPSGWHLNYNVRKKPSSLFHSLHTHTYPNTNRLSTWYSCSHTHTWANTHCNNYWAGCVRGSEGYRVLILWRLHRQNKEEKITRVCLEKECQCSRGPSVKHVSTKCHSFGSNLIPSFFKFQTVFIFFSFLLPLQMKQIHLKVTGLLVTLKNKTSRELQLYFKYKNLLHQSSNPSLLQTLLTKERHQTYICTALWEIWQLKFLEPTGKNRFPRTKWGRAVKLHHVRCCIATSNLSLILWN